MVKVHSSQSTAEVYNLKNVLESSGIECVIRGEHLRAGMGELPPIECWIELWIVDDAMKGTAERIIEGEARPTATPWTCPECGEAVDAEFDQCWKCQASRP